MDSGDVMKDIPSELKDSLANLDQSLSQLGESFSPLLSTVQTELHSKLNPLEQAKVDLVAVYAINSLFWAYLNTCGLNPKGKGVKTELDRIRTYMNRVKEIEDKKKAPRINADAALRFVRNSLWDAAHKKSTALQPQSPADPADGKSKTEARKEEKEEEAVQEDENVPSVSKMQKMSNIKKGKKKQKKHFKPKGKMPRKS